MSAKIPRGLLHFINTPIPLLSSYSSWPFISIIDRGEKKKKAKPKPQNQNTYSPQEKCSRPHKHCLTHDVIHQYLLEKAGDREKCGQTRELWASRLLHPFPRAVCASAQQPTEDTAARLHLHKVGPSGCLHCTEKASPLSSLQDFGARTQAIWNEWAWALFCHCRAVVVALAGTAPILAWEE